MKQNKNRLILGTSLGALLCAAPMIGVEHARHSVQGALAAADMRAAHVDFSLSGVVTLSGLEARWGDATLRIGRVIHRQPLGSLVSPALAQASGYTMEKLTFEKGAAKIDIPKIVIEGANFSKDDIARIFTADAGMPARLKGMSAKAVSIPEMVIKVDVKDAVAISYTIKGLQADDLQNGRIGRIVMAATDYDMKDKQAKQKGVIKRTEITGLDMVQSARVYFEKASADERPAPLYDSYTGEGMSTTVESAAAVQMDFGKFASGAVRARPLKSAPMADVILKLIEEGEKAKANPNKKADAAAAVPAFTMMGELMDSFEDDGMSAEGIRIAVGEKVAPVASFSIAKVAGTYGNATTPGGFKITGVDFKAPDVTGKIAEYSISGFSYAPTFAAMAEAMASGDADFKKIDPRKLMPKLGTTILKGLEIDAPDPKSPKGIKPERINVKLGNFMLGAKDQIRGIPTNIDFAVDGLAVKLPQNSADQAIKQLKALGYSAVDLSARLTAVWDEKTREVTLKEISVGGVDMGKAKITAVLGNIGREVFEADAAMAQVALMGATAKALNLQVDNTGLAEKAFAFQARSQNAKPEDLRKELGTAAALGIPAILGPSDEAKALAGAISKFIARPKTLKIDLKAKNAGGVGIPDIATVGDPQKAFGLVNVGASASD